VPVEEQFLLDQGVEPWDELPLWLASAANPDFAWMMAVDVSRAHTAGLRLRPLADTIRESGARESEPANRDFGSRGSSRGLDSARERELLAAWATLKA
jgi:2'-hydroxyisoflavone reductase